MRKPLPFLIILALFGGFTLFPTGEATAQAKDCNLLISTEAGTRAALQAVDLDESTRRALAVYRELLRPGAQIRLFPNTVGLDDRAIDLHSLDEAFAAWKASVDAVFAEELAAEAAKEAAEEPWTEASIALADARRDGSVIDQEELAPEKSGAFLLYI